MKYKNVFHGYGTEQKGEYFSLELTYNHGVDSYDMGHGFGHLTVAIRDMNKAMSDMEVAGFRPSNRSSNATLRTPWVTPSRLSSVFNAATLYVN